MYLVQGSGSAMKYPSERLICLGLGPQSVVFLISLCISVSLSFLPPFFPGQREMSHFILLPPSCHTVLPHRRLWLYSNETSWPWPKTMNRHQLFFIKLVFLVCHRDKKLTDHTWPPELERLGLSSSVSCFSKSGNDGREEGFRQGHATEEGHSDTVIVISLGSFPL